MWPAIIALLIVVGALLPGTYLISCAVVDIADQLKELRKRMEVMEESRAKT